MIAILADTVDAVSDLMLAESVHQLVGGNALRAGATVDAIGRGDTPPPVLDITRTPRRGGVVTHRLLATLGGAIPSGWTDTPRSQAEPRLAAFAANTLGTPARVLAGAQIVGPNGAVVPSMAMTLTDLTLGPLDGLALSASELAARFSRVAWSRRPSSTPVGSTIALNFGRDPALTSDTLSVNELMTVATSASASIVGARAATAMDFTTPDQTVDAAIDTAEPKSRADAAVVALNALGHFTDNTAADQALMDAAAFGVPNSVPLLDTMAWPVQTAAARTELQSRSTGVAALEASFDRSSASETALRDHDIARLQVVFGAGFQVAAALTAAFAGTLPSLFGSSAALLGNQPLEPVTWLARSARVRAGGRGTPVGIHDVRGSAKLVGAADPGRRPATRRGRRCLGGPAAQVGCHTCRSMIQRHARRKRSSSAYNPTLQRRGRSIASRERCWMRSTSRSCARLTPTPSATSATSSQRFSSQSTSATHHPTRSRPISL
jgi:hypothetical protein